MNEAPQRLRLLIADDHAVVIAGLRMLLSSEPGIEIIADAQAPDEAVRKAHTLRPDVVLMDIRFGPDGDASGIDACREIRSELPETKVIMFTSYAGRESVLNSVLAGATGFLTKNVGPGQIVEAILAAARGEALLDSSVTRGVIQRLEELTRGAPSPASALTEREKEVLLLIAQGYTNKEIAAKLVVSPFTARNHVIRILEKLGLSRRSEAAVQAVRLGLLKDQT